MPGIADGLVWITFVEIKGVLVSDLELLHRKCSRVSNMPWVRSARSWAAGHGGRDRDIAGMPACCLQLSQMQQCGVLGDPVASAWGTVASSNVCKCT